MFINKAGSIFVLDHMLIKVKMHCQRHLVTVRLLPLRLSDQYIYIYPNPSTLAGCDTRSILSWNSEFSFSKIDYHSKANEPSLH